MKNNIYMGGELVERAHPLIVPGSRDHKSVRGE